MLRLKNLQFARRRHEAAPGPRKRLRLPRTPAAVYAVGDIHGCLDLYLDLEEIIVSDAQQFPDEKLMILLGDLIDRGPKSAHVLDHLLEPPPDGFQRLCLCGNHEDLMSKSLDGKCEMQSWLAFGGNRTLESYGILPDPRNGFDLPGKMLRYKIDANIPREHFRFLAELPSSIEMDGFLFVHAGIDPARRMEDQREEDMLWIRNRFLEFDGLFEKTVVHGHTPVKHVHLGRRRIAVDTAAYLSGVLSAVRIVPGMPPKILQSNGIAS